MRATVEPKEQTAEPKPANLLKIPPVNKVAAKPEVTTKTVPKPDVTQKPAAKTVRRPLPIINQPLQKAADSQKPIATKPEPFSARDLDFQTPQLPLAPEVLDTVIDQKPIKLDVLPIKQLEGQLEEIPDTFLTDAETAELPVILRAELPFMDFVPKEKAIVADVDDVEIAEPRQTFSEQIAEYIQTLEPAMAEEAEAILDAVTEKIQLLLELPEPDEDYTSMDAEILQQELEVLCERLLVCLEIEPSSQNVKKLILSLKAEAQNKLESEELVYDQGTHEKKRAISHILDDFGYMIKQPTALLGKYAMQLAAVV